MIIANRSAVHRFMKRHANCRAALSAWIELVEKADWKNPADVKKDFLSASFISNNRVIFNIAGNNYRLLVIIIYVNGVLMIDWIGTHAEYDKKKF